MRRTMPLPDAQGRLAARAAAWAEQEIRAHPGLYKAFYSVIARSDGARALIGRARQRIRRQDGAVEAVAAPYPLAAQGARLALVAARLGVGGSGAT